jgi:hypothetical protein
MRTITMNDLGEAHHLPDIQLLIAATPVIDALQAIPDVTGRDGAGIAFRGRWVYSEAIDGWFLPIQLAAAYVVLRGDGCCASVIDAIEFARCRECSVEA